MRKNKLEGLEAAQADALVDLTLVIRDGNQLAWDRGQTINRLQRRLRKMKRKYAALHRAMKPHKDAAWRERQLAEMMTLEDDVSEVMAKAAIPPDLEAQLATLTLVQASFAEHFPATT
jgi:hypothetical protein